MTIQQFKSWRELNRFLKSNPVELPQSRINEIKTRAKKRKPTSFMVWINPAGHVVDLSVNF